MATIGTVAFLVLLGLAMFAKARFKERAAYRQRMTANPMRSMGNQTNLLYSTRRQPEFLVASLCTRSARSFADASTPIHEMVRPQFPAW
ncbi:hypothetical protein [Bradyrhizobium sp. th.b2]|uniref:hypothetical protein n=1 Tax=Bradyrhizobium sp. th-b2 TaxID=172088 RepID=UPI0003F6074E|nr:hypothetical protein [Bradyrhizobium sp. th.b2]